jgi:hypothetical protein
MLPGFERIVEERIRDAQRKGEFDDLPGNGKPITYEDHSLVPEELRLAHKILKNAGFLPPELELKKEIHRAEDLLSGVEETAEKYRILKRLNFMIMRLNSMRDKTIDNEFPQHYINKLAERCKSSSSKPIQKRTRATKSMTP